VPSIAEFRTDVETFVSRAVIDACAIADRHESSPGRGSRTARSSNRPAAASDSFTLAVAHVEERQALDRRARRDPEARLPSAGGRRPRVRHCAPTYGRADVSGDAYAGAWPTEAFTR
jgi:hypothetical protein